MQIKLGDYGYAEKDNKGKLILHINNCEVIHPTIQYHGEVIVSCSPSFLDETIYTDFIFKFDKYHHVVLSNYSGGIIKNRELWEENRILIKNIQRFIERYESKIDIDIEI